MSLKMRIKLLAISLLFFLLGCSSDANRIKRYLIDAEIDYQSYQVLVIIPYGGCSSCLQTAFDFMASMENDGSILFVISNVNDPRMMRLRLQGLVSSDNLIIDSSRKHINQGLNTMYPYIVYRDGETGFDVRIADPFNESEWQELESRMN